MPLYTSSSYSPGHVRDYVRHQRSDERPKVLQKWQTTPCIQLRGSVSSQPSVRIRLLTWVLGLAMVRTETTSLDGRTMLFSELWTI